MFSVPETINAWQYMNDTLREHKLVTKTCPGVSNKQSLFLIRKLTQ